MSRLGCSLALMLLLVGGSTARAQQTLSADDYLDRARGMWLGQIVGNYAGKSYEGTCQARGGGHAKTQATSIIAACEYPDVRAIDQSRGGDDSSSRLKPADRIDAVASHG